MDYSQRKDRHKTRTRFRQLVRRKQNKVGATKDTKVGICWRNKSAHEERLLIDQLRTWD